ncbi:cytochrome-c peroxidase [Lacinutrix neustonica]|uniref:Cytochrome-c peroxidase n=1 Tax=Lacinutrix neustonica TaxID=2980107 RepID=A0A9E8SD94_9FLAO|nr:cytochrome-c peroxidase [Lacinutrix neustonica]WAC02193.1 cytochrome-c peroxidase [Lacinutrix neustonica]
MKYFLLIIAAFLLIACTNDDSATDSSTSVVEEPPTISFDFSNLLAINFNSLLNYSEQYSPAYVTKDNTPAGNPITNEGATLGRILFYDKNLSVNNTVSCSSCHKQELAFSDDNTLSTGVDGSTGRHSMRLINTRFSNENRFLRDERANSLEEQTTMPIQDHVEMGFSGENGDLNFEDLITETRKYRILS